MKLLGAIIGDFLGSPFERHNISRSDFELHGRHNRFTDDTVLTVATADALLTDRDYRAAYYRWAMRYPSAGYGPGFSRWLGRGPEAPPYWSFGNGAAMRVSPVAWALDALDPVLDEARRSAGVTHSHPDGIRGAQAIAGATFLLRKGNAISEVHAWATDQLGLDLRRDLEGWRRMPGFSASANRTVPVAFAALRAASGFEHALRLAISAGGDSDTIAAMTGSMAAAHWSLPPALATHIASRLPEPMRAVCAAFSERFIPTTRPGPRV